MFDGTFFRFALGFTLIIAASLCALYFTGYFEPASVEEVASSPR